MASIVDLVRPEVAFDPETIAVLSAALEEAWDRLLESGSECTRPAYARAMREVVARRIIDMAHGAPTMKKSLLMVRFVFSLRTIDLITNADKFLRKRPLRRRRFPRLRLQAANKVCRCRNDLLKVLHLRGFRPPRTASG
jgi:hypothetical protein